MSLGLSLAFATNPFRLLVSCPWVREGLRGGVETWGCWGWGLAEHGDVGVKGQKAGDSSRPPTHTYTLPSRPAAPPSTKCARRTPT